MRVSARRSNVLIPGHRELLCKLCASLDYRVEGNWCDKCGLAYKARQPVTLDYILEQAGRLSR